MRKNQYQGLDKVYEFGEKEVDETINKDDIKTKVKKCNKSDLIYDANHILYKCHDITKFVNFSLKSKYSILANVFDHLRNSAD